MTKRSKGIDLQCNLPEKNAMDLDIGLAATVGKGKVSITEEGTLPSI